MNSDCINTDSADHPICRDFLRNVCKRGKRCKFFHPTDSECENIRRSERIFCHDFQNSVCRRPTCKFLHYSREDEELYRLTGYLSKEKDQTIDKLFSSTNDDEPPMCKDYFNGICSRGSSCKYRHVSASNQKQAHPLSNANITYSINRFASGNRIQPPPVPIPHALNSSINPMGQLNLQNSTLVPMVTSSSSNYQYFPPSLNANAHTGCEYPSSTVTDIFIGSSIPSAPLTNVDSCSPNIHHTLYAHPPSVGTLTPLVSVPSGAHSLPCSSVVAVVADASQHPSVLRHTTAIAGPHTSYHLVHNNSSQLNQQLLPPGSQSSTGPALFTIPLSQFGCDNRTPTALIEPSMASNSQQPATILANVLPNSQTYPGTPGQCYPSYNIVQINPPPVSESVPAVCSHHTITAVSTNTTASSSTTAVLAAAAAAGYIAGQLPVMSSGTHLDPHTSSSNPSSVNTKVPSVVGKTLMHTDPSSLTANIPAVSVAAAAAMAAAKAFVARSKSSSSGCDRLYPLDSEVKLSESDSSTESKRTESDLRKLAQRCNTSNVLSLSQISIPAVTSSTVSFSVAHASPATPIPKSKVSHSRPTNRKLRDQEEESAKTAAAVAAAACIGAMFSQPLNDVSTDSCSTVATVLGNLMNPPLRRLPSSSPDSPDDPHQQPTSRFLGPTLPHSSATPKLNVDSHQKPTSTSGCKSSGSPSCSENSMVNAPPSLSHLSLHEIPCHRPFHSSLHKHLDERSSWADVNTSVASAAHAAAAAAVAATAAVSQSAKYFHLSRQHAISLPKSVVASSSATQFPHNPFRSQTKPCFDDRDCPMSSVPEPDRTLSPNTAVTMTSAAAAAAMVAAASAVNEGRLLSGKRQSPFIECDDSSFEHHVDSEYPNNEKSSYLSSRSGRRYGAIRRRVKPRPNYDRMERNSSVDDSVDVYFYEKGDNMYARSEQHVGLSVSPDLTPSASKTDDSRPASCDTSPAYTTEAETYDRPHNYRLFPDFDHFPVHTFGRRGSSPTTVSPASDENARNTKFQSTPSLHQSSSRWPSDHAPILTCYPDLGTAKPMHRSMSLPDFRSNFNKTANLPVRSKSLSTINREISYTLTFRETRTQPTTVPTTMSRSTIYSPGHSKTTYLSNKKSYPKKITVGDRIGKKPSLHKLTAVPSSRRKKRSANWFRRSFIFSHPTTSPDSMITEDFSGHDDTDYPRYDDNEDYDDELYHYSAVPARRLPLATLYPKYKRNHPYVRSTSRTTIHSPPLRQEHILKAENCRLRRKLQELIRQRGDLRAANEILLEQNARLRHSNEHVSAVARMAESATKIIEAHNKTQLVYPTTQAVASYSQSATQVSHSLDPFPLAHPAAVVQPNTPVRGVYVSSPTAQVNQPTALPSIPTGDTQGTTQTLFPTAVVAGPLPTGAIALSPHQSLTTAIRLQAPTTDTLLPTSTPHPTCLTQQPIEAHHNVPNFFHPQIHHPIASIPVSIAAMPSHPSQPSVSSTLQVCHYPIASSGTVFSSHPNQASVVSPSVVSVGGSNSVTLLVGQASAAYPQIASHLPNAVHLQPVKREPTTAMNIRSLSHVPYVYQSSTPGTHCPTSNAAVLGGDSSNHLR